MKNHSCEVLISGLLICYGVERSWEAGSRMPGGRIWPLWNNLIMNKISTIEIKDAIISITKIEEEEYICLTDRAKAKEGDNRAADSDQKHNLPEKNETKDKEWRIYANRLIECCIIYKREGF